MKNIVVLFVLIITLAPCKGQMITEKHIDFDGKTSIIMDIQIADSIKIYTWDKQEISLKASVNINDNKDNEGYEIEINDAGTGITIDAGFKDDYFKDKKHSCIESMVQWEFYIPDQATFTLETINGNVIIDGNTGTIQAKTISGFIDWSVPSSCDASIQLKSITGTLWSNLDIESNSRPSSFPIEFSGKLKNGNNKVNLETISGNIYCRKSE